MSVCALSAFGCRPSAPERAVAARHADAEAGPRSLLLIVIDTLRADRLGLYGHSGATSPSLDEFARGAVVYESAVAAAPFTMPSMASIFTGAYPDRTGVVNHSRRDSLGNWTGKTMAEFARAAGHRTEAVVTNPWLANPGTGFRRGFDRFVTRFDADHAGKALDAEAVTDSALEAIDRSPGDRFLIWAHYLDPHMPYTPPAESVTALGLPTSESRVVEDFVSGRRSKSEIYFSPPYSEEELAQARRLYEAEIHATDRQIGRLLSGLEERGRAADTVVVVVSDHGESLGEHGLYFAHDFTVHEELVRAVLLVRIPGTPPARIATPVSLVDVTPSLCAWFGWDCPNDLDGRPVPLSAGTAEPSRDIFAAAAPYRPRYAEFPGHADKTIDGRWTMIRRGGRKVIDAPNPAGRTRFRFDLDADPGETRPLPSDPTFDSMSSSLDRWLDSMKRARPERPLLRAPANQSALRDSLRTELRSLGYIE